MYLKSIFQVFKKVKRLRLVVYNEQNKQGETIIENVNDSNIQSTINTIDWSIFHIVQLEDRNGYVVYVCGCLEEDGFAYGYLKNGRHILSQNPPNSLIEVTQIFINYLDNHKS